MLREEGSPASVWVSRTDSSAREGRPHAPRVRRKILRDAVDTVNYFYNTKNMETTNALAAFAALSQDNRLAIYRLLVEHGSEGLAAGAIGKRLGIAPATLSFHLKELAQARLIVARQDGRFIWYRADFDAMNALIGYLTKNCCRSSGVCGPSSCAPARSTKPAKRNSPPLKRSLA